MYQMSIKCSLKNFLCRFDLEQIFLGKREKSRNKTPFRAKSTGRGGGLIPGPHCMRIFFKNKSFHTGVENADFQNHKNFYNFFLNESFQHCF